MHHMSHRPRGISLGRIDPEAWIGGKISLPGDAPGAVCRDLIVWCAGDAVLGAAALLPGVPDRSAALSLIDAMRAPLSGRPRRPRCLRVASPSLGAALQARFGPRIEIVVAPTPEIDALAAEVARCLRLPSGTD